MSKANIYFLGDFHIGNKSCNYGVIDEYIRAAKKDKNAHVILMGDILESSLTGKYGMWDQEINPQKQFDMAIRLLKPIAAKIDYVIVGNHEMRISKETSFDVSKLMAEMLDAEYLGPGGQIDIAGINIVVYHGSGRSVNSSTQLDRAYRIYPLADVIALGHNHHLFCKEYHSYNRKGEIQTTYGIRTGSALQYPDYARRSLLPPADLGFPIVEVVDGKIVKIKMRLGEY